MQPEPLNYAPVIPRRSWPRWVIWGGVSFLILLTFLFIPGKIVRTKSFYIDAVSGSQMTRIVVLKSSTTSQVVTVSPLEKKFREMGLQVQNNWQFLTERGENGFGSVINQGCGTAPEIYNLSFHTEIQQYFIDHSSDDEIRAFFIVMTTGSALQQKIAIEAISDSYFNAAK